MTYENFKESLAEAIEKALPETVSLEWREVTKNNNCIFDGIVFNKAGENISPTIYANALYEDYRRGRSMENIVDGAILSFEYGMKMAGTDFDYLLDFDEVKDRIIFRTCNKEKNNKMLGAMPHRDIMDLSITYSVLISSDVNNDSVIRIKDEHLRMWNTSEDELYEIAMKNTPRLLPDTHMTIAGMLRERMSSAEGEGIFAVEPLMPYDYEPSYPLYVLTNKSRICGAGCIFYPKLLEKLEKELGGGFYILPSSVHEVLLLPESDAGASVDSLNGLVTDVNDCCVSDEEYLSDHIYYFSREQGLKSCA